MTGPILLGRYECHKVNSADYNFFFKEYRKLGGTGEEEMDQGGIEGHLGLTMIKIHCMHGIINELIKVYSNCVEHKQMGLFWAQSPSNVIISLCSAFMTKRCLQSHIYYFFFAV